jgi:hypothetical protein
LRHWPGLKQHALFRRSIRDVVTAAFLAHSAMPSPTNSRRLMRNDESLFRHETTISGMPGDRLSITLMMGQSNDWFYAPAESGIDLFQNGKAMSGNISAQLYLWNAGTEVDQEAGIGSEQGPRRKGPNTGKRENGVAQKIQDGKPYSNASSVLCVTITPAIPRCNIAYLAILPTASAAWSDSAKSGWAALLY